ncbi:MAG: hypothetical protein PHE48_00320 [Candidatus Daviesbacteria bacterium]|nr:hypothetical protein [Candidatus Daviesbacteria bacterium]
MKLKIAQVIGLNTDQKAAQAASAVREDSTFLAVLELISDDAFTKGRAALSEIEDFYFESEGGAGEKLTATFKEFEEKFLGEEDFSLGLAVISGKILYLIGKGQVEVNLKRKDKLLSLLSVGTPSQSAAKQEACLVSGFLEDGDKLLISTKSFITFLGSELEKSLDLPIESFEEEIESKIGASELDNQGLAALAVAITEEDTEISPLSPREEEVNLVEQNISEDSAKKISLPVKAIASYAFRLSKWLKTYFPKSGRGRLILAVVLLLIIASGIGYKYKLSRDRERQTQFSELLQQAKDDFNSAKAIASLNPTDAKNKLDTAQDKVNKALVLKPKDQEALSFKNQIEQDSAGILQQSSVFDFPVFLDMDLVKKNFQATQMSLSGGKLLLLDQGVKTLAVVDLAKKSNQILAGSEKLGEASFASINGGFSFVYSQDKGILKVDIANSKLTTVAKKDSDWGDIKDIYGFAGNVYLLDSGNPSAGSGQIWKYLPAAEGYSDKREYLSKETKVDLSGTLRMQIESSVYVLKNGGEILRFTKGNKDNFSYSGLPSGVKDPKSIFTSSDTDNLYLLDSGNSRLLILTKTGSYKGQITGAKFGVATDLVVDEKNKKVYLIEGSKIYTADLK